MKILMLTDIPEDTGTWIGRYLPLANSLAANEHNVFVLMPRHKDHYRLIWIKDIKENPFVGSIGQPYFKKINEGRKNYNTVALIRIALINLIRILVFAFKLRPDVIFLGKPLPVTSTAAII